MEEKFLQSESLKIGILDEPSGLGAEIILSKMRECFMFEAKWDTMTLDGLMAYADGHLRYIDKGAGIPNADAEAIMEKPVIDDAL
jgi:hypothetical protein